MPLELFVWYRSPPELADRVRQAAQQVLEQAARQYGVQGRLLQRTDAGHTWMEHYPLATHDDDMLRALAAGAGAWAAGLPPRHGEHFACLDRPATPAAGVRPGQDLPEPPP